MVGKIYAGILVDRVHKVTDGLIGDEQGGFREGLCRSDLHHKTDSEKPLEKKCRVYVGFMDLEKA